MRRRIVALGAVSLVLLVAGFVALWVGPSYFSEIQGPGSALEEDVREWVGRQVWLTMLYRAGGPFVGAGLIAGVAALALVVRERQLAGTRAEAQAGGPAASPRQS
jgi:hypothetical protein